jgi:hypothetical protein
VSGTARIVAALRPATLVAGGAFAVHEASYLAGYGGAGSPHAHAYVAALLPVLAVLLALTLVVAVEAGVAGRGAIGRRRSPLGRVLVYAGAILALFTVQEITAGLLVAGHPGIDAFAAPSGLVAIPLALVFGALAWLAARGLEAVEERLTARFAPRARRARRASPRPGRAAFFSPPALSAGAAPRAPPSI